LILTEMQEEQTTTYMNTNKICIVCMKKPEKRENHIKINGQFKMIEIPLQRHHVTYSPQLIAYVHDHCHVEINEGKHPHLVQYEQGESREYYDKKKL